MAIELDRLPRQRLLSVFEEMIILMEIIEDNREQKKYIQNNTEEIKNKWNEKIKNERVIGNYETSVREKGMEGKAAGFGCLCILLAISVGFLVYGLITEGLYGESIKELLAMIKTLSLQSLFTFWLPIIGIPILLANMRLSKRKGKTTDQVMTTTIGAAKSEYQKELKAYLIIANPRIKKCESMISDTSKILTSYYNKYAINQQLKNYQTIVFIYMILKSYSEISVHEAHKWARDDEYQQQMLSIAKKISKKIDIMRKEMNEHFEQIHTDMQRTIDTIKEADKNNVAAIERLRRDMRMNAITSHYLLHRAGYYGWNSL